VWEGTADTCSVNDIKEIDNLGHIIADIFKLLHVEIVQS